MKKLLIISTVLMGFIASPVFGQDPVKNADGTFTVGETKISVEQAAQICSQLKNGAVKCNTNCVGKTITAADFDSNKYIYTSKTLYDKKYGWDATLCKDAFVDVGNGGEKFYFKGKEFDGTGTDGKVFIYVSDGAKWEKKDDKLYDPWKIRLQKLNPGGGSGQGDGGNDDLDGQGGGGDGGNDGNPYQINITNIENFRASIVNALGVSVWRDADGEFNTSRLLSDSIAGVVLGTAGGLITSSVVKKNQIEEGYENIHCTVGGQNVANWGDEFVIGMTIAR